MSWVDILRCNMTSFFRPVTICMQRSVQIRYAA